MDITKTESNNIVVLLYIERKNKNHSHAFASSLQAT